MIDLLIVIILFCTSGVAVAIALRPHGLRLGSEPTTTSGAPTVSVLEYVGRSARALFGQEAEQRSDRAVGFGLVTVPMLAVINPGLGVVGGVGLWVRSVLQRRNHTQQEADRIGNALGDVIDLFAVALVSGDTVAEAVRQVSHWSDSGIAEHFAWCTRQADAGRALADSLEDVPNRLGQPIRPLVAALVATERYGAPITANLAQLAIDTRADRRRRAEASARRLPVVLLFPLVVCVLPAFLLVTVVPVIFETVSNFEFSASP